MTISIHPARQVNEEVPPGTWEGTKQDAVLATAQLLEVLSRKKGGEKAPFGFSEYDAQMANAQLRAFKLTKVIMRKARRNSLPDAHVTIEEMGFQTESDPNQIDPNHVPKPLSSPPTCALPTPPKQSHSKTTARSKSSSPPTRKVKPSASVPITKFPPPIPPRKSSNRLSLTPPPSSHRYSDELSPRSIPRSPLRNNPVSPVPRSVSPRREATPPLTPKDESLDTLEAEILPVLPYRRVKIDAPEPTKPELVARSPIPNRKPPVPQRSPRRPSISNVDRTQLEMTQPLKVGRSRLKRTVSFRFGEGLQSSRLSRTSSMICSELSDALKDLQRTIGAASVAVEVH
jgi:hypothetical protein